VSRSITCTLTLTAEQAAGLLRFAGKVCHSDAQAVLYGHVAGDLRSEQAHQIMSALAAMTRVLESAGVSSWPWLETGKAP
jgi:hypothetical protein